MDASEPGFIASSVAKYASPVSTPGSYPRPIQGRTARDLDTQVPEPTDDEGRGGPGRRLGPDRLQLRQRPLPVHGRGDTGPRRRGDERAGVPPQPPRPRPALGRDEDP